MKLIKLAAAACFALIAANGSAKTLYVSADMAETGDGESWATAYKHVTEAVAAFTSGAYASEAEKEIRVSQGIYQFTAKVTQPAGCVIKGGYKGGEGDDADTRDVDEYQTIFTADKTLDDRWNHVVVGDDGNVTVTDSGINIYQTDETTGKTRLVLPAMTEGADDAYICRNVGSNGSFAWKFADNTGTLDGIWYHYNGALVAASDYGTTVKGVATIRNCRLIGAGNLYMSGTTSPYIGYDIQETLIFGVNVANDGFMCYKQAAYKIVNRDNTFRSCYAEKGGPLGFGSAENALVEHCISMGTLFDSIGAPKNSVFRNNYSGGVITGVGNSTLSNCVFACNRKIVKTASASSYYFVGENTSAATGYIYDSLFASNKVVVLSVSPSISRYAVGIVGQGDFNSNLYLANCTFDHNTAEGIEVEGIGAYISRGSVLFNYPVTGKGGATTIANCTFLSGDEETLAYDVVSNSKTTTVRNSIFMSDADVAQAITADGPAYLVLEANTAKNVLTSPLNKNGGAADAKWQYDEIPLQREVSGLLVPKAATPGIRNCGTFLKNTDAEGTTYTADNKIRGAVARINQPPDTKVLVLRKNPVNGGDFDCDSAVAVGADGVTVTATARSGSAFAKWTTPDGEDVSTDNPLTLGALETDPTILVANFEMAKLTVTFDLGDHATFVESGERVCEIEVDQGADFPSVPAYTVDEGWFFTGWDQPFPSKVDASFAATAQYVESYREVHIQEGDDFAAAYAYAGVSSGKVFAKGGTYPIAALMQLKRKVEVVSEDGGRIVLTGTNSAGVATTDYCFNLNSTQAAIDAAAFEKVDFVGFKNAAIYAHGTAAKGAMTLNDCTFTNCTTCIDLASADLTLTDVIFASGSGTAVAMSGNCLTATRVTVEDRVMAGTAGFALSSVTSTFEGCKFLRCLSNGAGPAGGLLVMVDGGSAAFTDCEFSDNRLQARPFGMFQNSGTLAFTRCRLERNVMTCWFKNGSAGMFSNSGTLAVRDCWFADNKMDITKHDDAAAGTFGGILYNYNSGTATFVNTSFVRGSHKVNNGDYGTSAANFLVTGGSVAFVNCVIDGTELTHEDEYESNEFLVTDTAGSRTVAFVNTAVVNADDPDYKAVAATTVRLSAAGSVLAGWTALQAEMPEAGANDYAIQTYDASVGVRVKNAMTDEVTGVIAAPVSVNAPASGCGVQVWEKENVLYFKDKTYVDETKPWRSAINKATHLAELPEDAALLVDAFGAARGRRSTPGPLARPLGMALIVR